MNIVIVGGGPAGLFLAILMKKADGSHDITVIERNRPEDTFGFGVVFSDATLGNLAAADPESYARITRSFARWDDIDTHIGGQVIRSRGHGFCGLERKTLLLILQQRCRELGVSVRFETEVPDGDVSELRRQGADLIVAADGVGSQIRQAHAEHFEPSIDMRPNRFVWLGTTYPFTAFTFYFKESEHGLFRVHAYRYSDQGSTFIVECTEDTWRRAGLDSADEDQTIAYLEGVFAAELGGHALTRNRSIWRSFPTVRNQRWHHDDIVLVGDAAHTAHFSIGSGTKLAMEDCIALAAALQEAGSGPEQLPAALTRYEAARRPEVEALQRAAQVSLEWFEQTERYTKLGPLTFTCSLLTRSLRLTHGNLARRDPELMRAVDRAFEAEARAQTRRGKGRGEPDAGPDSERAAAGPPMFTPYRLRSLTLANRVVAAPMSWGGATDGIVGDFHLMHLGSQAMGGAGLVMTETVAVMPEGRVTPSSAGLYQPAAGAAFARIVHFVHRHSAAAIGVMLGHAGRRAGVIRAYAATAAAAPDAAGWPLMAASAVPYQPGARVPRAMTRDDMEAVRDAFVAATAHADRAGFDILGVQLAGGYLLAGFLSPLTNQRDDDHSGLLDNRMRFPLEVVYAVRAAWPAHKPLVARISATDWHEGGLGPDDAVVIARALARAGCDIVEVTTGENVADELPATGRLYQVPFADRIRNETGIPVMAEGGINSHDDINSVLCAGRADLCVLGRAQLFDPNFCRRAAWAQGHELPWPEPFAAAREHAPR